MRPQNFDACRSIWRMARRAAPLTALALLVGCNETADPNGETDMFVASLSSFPSCDSLDEYIVDLGTEMFVDAYAYGVYGVDVAVGGGARGVDDALGAPTSGAEGSTGDGGGSAPAPSPEAPTDFTDTNVQEVGVDEPDMVKTDGEYLYVVQGQTLHIVDSWPAEDMHEVATLELPGWGDRMFLADDHVVVFSQVTTGPYPEDDYYYGEPGDVPGGEPTTSPEPGRATPEGDPESDFGDEDGDAGGEDSGSSGSGSSDSDSGDADPDSEPGEPTPDDDPEEPDSSEPIPGERPDGEWEEPEHDPDPLDDGVWFQGTRTTIIDVSDRSDPTVVSTFDIEGSMVNARLVDGQVFLVTNAQLLGFDFELQRRVYELDLPEVDWDASAEERDAAADEVRRLIKPVFREYFTETGRDLLIPDLRTSADDRANVFSCSDLMRPGVRAGLSVLAVIGFDPASPSPEGVGILADGWHVYGSATSLYVAQDSRWWSWPDRDDAFAETHLHRFALGDGDPAYEASGSVPGWLLNQFSMSERDGYLRVATTDRTEWGWGRAVDGGAPVSGGTATSDGGDTVVLEPGSTEPAPDTPDSGSDGGSDSGSEPDSGGGSDDAPDAGSDGGSSDKDITRLIDTDEEANNVFVLERDGNRLEIVGGIRGMAPGEEIYSVRFVGEMGYVVTFRQTDPLFAIDLSDPVSPQLRGELHIPGYSSYLHPFGDHYLIGVGRDGTDDGRVLGFQLQLFDVSDPENPTRTHQEVLTTGDGEWSSSAAEHDHHAFTFYEGRNLLAVPVTLEDYGWDADEYSHFSGIIVFEVSAEDGFVEVGRISHSYMAHDRYCGDFPEDDPEASEACDGWDYPWWVEMQRSRFIEDYLFAISDQGVTSSTIEGLDDVLAEVRY